MSELHKFIFDGLPVRGILVRLTDGWQEILSRRRGQGDVAGSEFAQPVRGLLGEMAAAAVLMRANIKFNGALVLQFHGDGPVKLAVAEVQPDLAFRVTATVVGEVPQGAQVDGLLNLHGQGRCVITLDPKDKLPGQVPYQGVVPLHGDQREPLTRLSDVLEHYMLQSEQLDTKLVLAANDSLAAGLLIQRLPVQGQGNIGGPRNEDEIGLNESYNRIAHLASTLTSEELLSLDADTIMHRLFWEEPLLRFEPQTGHSAPRFSCTCSRERVSHMLRGLGVQEVESLLREQGRADIGCEFCGQHYFFDAVDAANLFVPVGSQAPGSPSMN